MARVGLENVSKVFAGGIVAADGVTVDVADGEFMVVVGPSGCGKTTLLRMIAGLEDVSEGRVRIGEDVVNDVPARERDVAMVFQHCALYPHMSVFENMAFGLRVRKVGRVEMRERVAAAAEMLGIEGLLARKPRSLSGGQVQRVAIGRAIVRSPKAFLLDEPLSNLDAGMRTTMRAELKRLHRRLGTTTIYVTHDQAEAMTLGDRVCVMREGKVQQTARPMEVYDRPVNRFVAGFFGAPSMNFFEGRIVQCGGGYCFELDGRSIALPERFKEAVSGYAGQEMVMGVRPEDFVFERARGDYEVGIGGKVRIIEPLGDRKEVYVEREGGKEFVVSLGARERVGVDGNIEVFARGEAVHLFEAGVTGRNVLIQERSHEFVCDYEPGYNGRM
jgi:multiple sugar transport system ATP-binding protein